MGNEKMYKLREG